MSRSKEENRSQGKADIKMQKCMIYRESNEKRKEDIVCEKGLKQQKK